MSGFVQALFALPLDWSTALKYWRKLKLEALTHRMTF